MTPFLSEAQWAEYEAQGYLRLGHVMDPGELESLQQQIDAIMMGTATLDYDRIMMQLDRDPAVGGDKPGPQTRGHKAATLCYRKIQGLEYDPLFLQAMTPEANSPFNLFFLFQGRRAATLYFLDNNSSMFPMITVSKSK